MAVGYGASARTLGISISAGQSYGQMTVTLVCDRAMTIKHEKSNDDQVITD